MAGLVRTLDTKTWFDRNSVHYNMMVSTKDLSVNEELCSDPKCHLSCKSVECNVCYHCLEDHRKTVLKDAILEHNSKWNTKRIIPFTSDPQKDNSLSEENKNHLNWFKGKCLQNKEWCN